MLVNVSNIRKCVFPNLRTQKRNKSSNSHPVAPTSHLDLLVFLQLCALLLLSHPEVFHIILPLNFLDRCMLWGVKHPSFPPTYRRWILWAAAVREQISRLVLTVETYYVCASLGTNDTALTAVMFSQYVINVPPLALSVRTVPVQTNGQGGVFNW